MTLIKSVKYSTYILLAKKSYLGEKIEIPECAHSGYFGKYSGIWGQYLVKNSGMYGKFSDI